MSEIIPVSSSNIRTIQYNEDQQVLAVSFHNGSVYNYYDVPAATWLNLRDAGSKGQYLAQNIKGHFSYQKVL